MKTTTFITLLFAALLVSCGPKEPEDSTGLTTDTEVSANGNVGATCNTPDDCVLPTNYAIRSVCPFDMRCINAKCAVVCPLTDNKVDPDTGLTTPVSCSADADCDCEEYAPSNSRRCACVDNACVIVTEE